MRNGLKSTMQKPLSHHLSWCNNFDCCSLVVWAVLTGWGHTHSCSFFVHGCQWQLQNHKSFQTPPLPTIPTSELIICPCTPQHNMLCSSNPLHTLTMIKVCQLHFFTQPQQMAVDEPPKKTWMNKEKPSVHPLSVSITLRCAVANTDWLWGVLNPGHQLFRWVSTFFCVKNKECCAQNHKLASKSSPLQTQTLQDVLQQNKEGSLNTLCFNKVHFVNFGLRQVQFQMVVWPWFSSVDEFLQALSFCMCKSIDEESLVVHACKQKIYIVWQSGCRTTLVCKEETKLSLVECLVLLSRSNVLASSSVRHSFHIPSLAISCWVLLTLTCESAKNRLLPLSILGSPSSCIRPNVQLLAIVILFAVFFCAFLTQVQSKWVNSHSVEHHLKNPFQLKFPVSMCSFWAQEEVFFCSVASCAFRSDQGIKAKGFSSALLAREVFWSQVGQHTACPRSFLMVHGFLHQSSSIH